jgi:aspartyl-tRNA(Asn)/glutamyl-tRNA(Gln) amidotransferase subunit B
MARYYEETMANTKASPKLAANWIIGDLTASLNKMNLDIVQSPITATQLAILLDRITDNTISGKIAKTVFEAMWQGEGDPDTIISQKGLTQITDTSELENVIDKILAAHSEQVEQYRAGKERVFGFFVGQVMKETKGQANPAQVNEILKKKLTG